jgi:porphobilinogen synthase
MHDLTERPTILLEPSLELPSRPRRLRSSAALRDSVAEIILQPQDFIAPFFVVPGSKTIQHIQALPGISRFSVDEFLPQLERALKLGVRSFVIFGVLPQDQKDATATSASDPSSVIPSAIRAARAAFGNDIVLYSDVCLCTHTDHGHCGLLRETSRGVVIDNDSSLVRLADMALTHAEAGVDFVAPSDMMDGRIGYIRKALDAGGLTDVGILSYAVKYASAFYGPFREAAGSAPSFGDRSSYQMDYRNTSDALREASLDEAEGADMLMVKPALPYLDVIAKVKNQTNLPVVAYNVSGEYAMLKAAASVGALIESKAVCEALTSIKRAGSSLIISYHALEAIEKGWI